MAEGSPVKALVEELLKGDAVGDDGGALVDAIAGAYDGQDAAKTRLDALLTDASTTDTTDDDGNTVTTTTPESGRIVDIETSIAGLTGDDASDVSGKLCGNRSEHHCGLCRGLRWHDRRLVRLRATHEALHG